MKNAPHAPLPSTSQIPWLGVKWDEYEIFPAAFVRVLSRVLFTGPAVILRAALSELYSDLDFHSSPSLRVPPPDCSYRRCDNVSRKYDSDKRRSVSWDGPGKKETRKGRKLRRLGGNMGQPSMTDVEIIEPPTPTPTPWEVGGGKSFSYMSDCCIEIRWPTFTYALVDLFRSRICCSSSHLFTRRRSVCVSSMYVVGLTCDTWRVRPQRHMPAGPGV